MDTFTAVQGVRIVSVDYAAGIRQAMRHLVLLGHRRIGFISGPLELASAKVREEAFLEGLREHGLRADPRWMKQADHRVEGGHHAMQRILKASTRPTAVIGSNDLTALGAMGAIHEAGLSIPEDISVIGFDNIQISAYTRPALTTIHVPRRELAATAFRSLFRSREEGKRSRHWEHVVDPRLLIRESTAEPPRQRAVVAAGVHRQVAVRAGD